MSDITKKAFQAAEQALEDKEVARLKGIITNLLTRKKDKEAQLDELGEDIKVIKQDIEDFKAGRLDKIKERHDTNPRADRSSPITITIINDNSRITYAQQPWKWNYGVVWGGNTSSQIGWTSASVSAMNLANATNTVYLSGTTASTFTSGTYTVNGGSVSL
jgi:phage baseplate assembly protein gpV